MKSFCESLVFNFKGSIKCVSLNNQHGKARAALVDINSNETHLKPFTVSFNKCGGSCSTIGDLQTLVCRLNKIKNMNEKVFNLMSRVNETRFLISMNRAGVKCGLTECYLYFKTKIESWRMFV